MHPGLAVRRLGLPQNVTTTSSLRRRFEMAAPRKRQQQVHRKWRVRQGARRGDLSTQSLRREESDRPQAAGLRHRHGEPVAGQATAHSSLNHRQVYPDPLQERRHRAA